MKLYQIQVTKTAIYRTAPVRIPRGITGAALELRFSEEWEGLKKTAVFRAGDVTRDVLDVGSTVVIPWECTQEAGAVLEVGIYGTGEDRAIPTLWAVIGTVCEATDPSGDTGTDPALPVWAQLQNRTNDLQDQLDQLEEQGVRDKSIDEAVAGYIADNPIVPEDLGIAPAEVGVFAAEGTVVTASGTGALPPHSLKLFGRTVQNGTPNPLAPVPLVSVGSGGTVKTKVLGKNLFYPDWYSTKNEDGTFSIAGLSSGAVATLTGKIPAGTYTLSYLQGHSTCYLQIGSAGDYSLTLAIGGTKTFQYDGRSYLRILCSNVPADTTATYKIQLEAGAAATAFEPYKEQTLTAATPNGLPGVPAASGGNYTDENGQAWVCDEIDFARGVYVQRVNKWTPKVDTAIDAFNILGNCCRIGFALSDPAKGRVAYCTHLSALHSYDADEPHFYCDSYLWLFLPVSYGTTKEAVRAWMVENNIAVLYPLTAPIETALSEEELAAFAAMRTNDPNTVVYNDAMAPMRLEYYTPISALPVAGGSMGGNLRMAGNRITDLGTPSANGDAVNKAYSDSKLVEDIGYPGCYYRMVDGVEEWLNPPMVTGVEYRTAERFENMAVFAKLIDYGALPTGGSYKRYNISGGTAVRPISAIAVLSSGEVIGNGQGFAVSNSRSYSINVTTTTTQVEIYSPTADYSALTATVLVKYTKDI